MPLFYCDYKPIVTFYKNVAISLNFFLKGYSCVFINNGVCKTLL